MHSKTKITYITYLIECYSSKNQAKYASYLIIWLSIMSLLRCSWCLASDLYMNYHDKDWGKPIYDDQKLFEYLVLESAQAGLSWITILKKREGYRKAFHQFNINKVAKITSAEQDALLLNPDIVRHKGKIQATINNAQQVQKIIVEFGSFSHYFWSFSDHKIIDNHPSNIDQVPASTELSHTIAKDLKKRGFKFFGPTTCYAFMQATGMVNDHVESCTFRLPDNS